MIRVVQRAAGSGKTFESVQLINEHRDKQYSTYIYMTKTHSAKDVIHFEWESQQREGLIHDLYIISDSPKEQKQYRIQYKDTAADKTVAVFMGTIDSFTYALVDMCNVERTQDLFKDIASAIGKGQCKDLKCIKYARANIKLDKSCVVIVDEAQDLGLDYSQALDYIVQATGIDVYVVGDKLQSLFRGDNLMTRLDVFKSPVDNSSRTNVIRRFKDQRLVDFVSSVVPFQDYGLPSLQSVEPGFRDSEEVLVLLEVDPVSSLTFDEKKLNPAMKRVCCKVIKQMEQYAEKGFNPEDFMVVFPLISTNPLAQMLQAHIQDFWVCNKNRPGTRFVFLHRSEENKPIDLTMSIGMTRILSVHAAKGNGAPVVFVLQLTEQNINKFAGREASPDKKLLVYHSFLHVAFTRQKRFLNVFIEKNEDLVYKSLPEENVQMDPEIESAFKFPHNLNTSSIIERLRVTSEMEALAASVASPERPLVEYGDHLIRYAYINLSIFFWFAMRDTTLSKEESTMQFIAILQQVMGVEPVLLDFRQYRFAMAEGKFRRFPVLVFKQPHYQRQAELLQGHINAIQEKFRSAPLDSDTLGRFCHVEVLIILFMVQLNQRRWKSVISNMDLYHMLENVDTSHSAKMNCSCARRPPVSDNNLYLNQQEYYQYLQRVKERVESVIDYATAITPDFRSLYAYNMTLDVPSFNVSLISHMEFVLSNTERMCIIHITDMTQVNAIQRLQTARFQSAIVRMETLSDKDRQRGFKDLPVTHIFVQMESDNYMAVEFQDLEGIQDPVKEEVEQQYTHFHPYIASVFKQSGAQAIKKMERLPQYLAFWVRKAKQVQSTEELVTSANEALMEELGDLEL